MTNMNGIKQKQKKAVEGEISPLGTDEMDQYQYRTQPTMEVSSQRTELSQCVGTPGKRAWGPQVRKGNQWLQVTSGSDRA